MSSKLFYCPRCQGRYGEEEIIIICNSTYLCPKCDFPLEEETEFVHTPVVRLGSSELEYPRKTKNNKRSFANSPKT